MTVDEKDPIVGATILGRYRIVARLAAGGMGVVYLARAEGAAGFAKPMVVKRILPDLMGNDQMARLFVREAKILANLQHANIVGVTDFGEEAGAYIMVLDYVRAYHLGLWLLYRESKGQRLPVECALHIMIKVLDALEYAHTLSMPDGTPLDIVHADISPANILVDTDGQVKLLDFGIARMRGEVTKSTDTSSIRGKFSYLPVEALDGSPPRVATDVYASGVTLYELLAGENPFTKDDETITLARVISHDPPPISAVRPDLPPELDAILARAMSKDRTKRFDSAKDFAKELRRVQTTAEDEAARSLAALAKEDYAEMPALAGVSLADLEEAWRSPPSAGKISVVPTGANVALGLAPTQAPLGSPPRPHAPPAKGRAALVVGALVFVVAAAAVVIAVVVTRREDPEDPKFIYVERGGAASASASSTVSVPPPASDSASAVVPPAAPRDAGRTARPVDPISAAFAKKQPLIEACFEGHPADVSSHAEVSIRFAIGADGAVQRAELAPAELGGVPLGQCILDVARKTQFPPQAGPTSFRIPLRAKKTG